MTTKSKNTPSATHIRFTDRIEAMLAEASERTGLPKAEVVRITTSIGLRYLAAINYDIDGAIFEKAQKLAVAASESKLSECSETSHQKSKRRAG
jgi:hypothetical protein